jgi:uncharacterized protein HemY
MMMEMLQYVLVYALTLMAVGFMLGAGFATALWALCELPEVVRRWRHQRRALRALKAMEVR